MNIIGKLSLEVRLKELITLHEGPLVRYAAHITRDIDLARDVVQDTFVKWIETQKPDSQTGSPPEDRRLQSWLFAVCRNRALDIIRREKNMNRIGDNSETLSSSAPDPSDNVEQQEERSRVTAALDQLPQREQEVLRLKYQNGFTYRQIAEITGNSLSHVGVLIHTGLQRLRRKFNTIGLLGRGKSPADIRGEV